MKRNLKRNLCLLLSLLMLLTVAACSKNPSNTDTSTPVPNTPVPNTPVPNTPVPDTSTPAPVETINTFLWDDFTGRDPNSKPDVGPNGANIWWDNWANLRASVDNGIASIQFRPKAFDPEDYDNEDAYYASAADWMGNWGEAMDMWSLDGISWCKYFTIRIKGTDGGEEKKLILHFQPEDSDVYAVRFKDLILKDGGKAVITTDWQDLVIDLAASGLPGMTNRMHIRAFSECKVDIDELYFSEVVGAIDATSKETILAGITVSPTADIGGLPIKEYVAEASGRLLWDDFTERDPNSKPDVGPNGASIWWDNWANLRASVEDGVASIQFRPKAFDPEDYDDEDAYYASAADWMGNWGEAMDMWSLDGIQWCKYFTIRMKGADGGEENKLILHFQPEDGDVFAARFSDLILKDGSKAVITTEWQDVVIDLEASGFPGMTNRLHIRAFAECKVDIDELYFSDGVGAIDTTSKETILAGITVQPTGNIGEMPIKDYVAELN